MKKILMSMTLLFTLIGGSAFANMIRVDDQAEKIMVDGERLSLTMTPSDNYQMLVLYKKKLYTCYHKTDESIGEVINICFFARYDTDK